MSIGEKIWVGVWCLIGLCTIWFYGYYAGWCRGIKYAQESAVQAEVGRWDNGTFHWKKGE